MLGTRFRPAYRDERGDRGVSDLQAQDLRVAVGVAAGATLMCQVKDHRRESRMKTSYFGLTVLLTVGITLSMAHAESDGSQIDEIVVTATKREEKLANVPTSIAFVSADTI